MSNRSWFFASGDKQQGPYPEDQFRDFIAKGLVRADTLVWSEGMAGWQRAGDVPGLISGGSGPPAFLPSDPYPADGAQIGGPLSAEFGTWALFGRFLIYGISYLLIIPLPWAVTALYRWLVAHLRVPRWPNATFTGKPGDIWYVFIILALCAYAGLTGIRYIGIILFPLEAFLSWMIVGWVVANLSPDGHQRPLTFIGSVWTYIGWHVLILVSAVTIIGWAWVVTAWMRWTCRNVEGNRREVVFNGSGWQVLWRTFVLGLTCAFIIPIPWMLAWYTRWYVSQFALLERAV